ncbi:hypothetical protein GCM10017774_13770 [Lentzea cavernae]|uniref:Uncharacterized protein n=1 Tax=Lentzea cavernae TaxID=2020703 RepID=A0ABQ3M4V6_9PSEU|nr:hypothetical protein GCM10017774_13770 [Lentzea cavernae]
MASAAQALLVTATRLTTAINVTTDNTGSLRTPTATSNNVMTAASADPKKNAKPPGTGVRMTPVHP